MNSATRRPRVVHVITRLIVGGAQLSVVGLCEGLNDYYDVYIVAGPQTGPEGSLHERAREVASLTVVEALRREVSLRWDPIAVPKLRKVLGGLDCDIVHTHSSKAGIVGRFAAAPLRAGVVHTIHGWGHTPTDSPLRRASFIALERAAAKRSDALVAVSVDNEKDGLADRIGSAEHYHVIPEIVDLDPIDSDFQASRARARAALGVKEDVEVIGWVGRFVEQKDPRTLAGALRSLLAARPSSHAVLVGDGPLRGMVEAELCAAGLRERTTMTGVVHGARKLMPAFDVLIHPSRWEGNPMVIQEALAERIPVVSSKVSGISDLVKDTTGRVVPQQSPAEMAAATMAVLDSPLLKAPLSAKTVDALKVEYGREAALRRHIELYDSILDGRR